MRRFGIKRSAQDIRFSKLIRERDNYTCRRCGKSYLPNSQGLHAAHMFTRRTRSTRFDEANVMALDFGCHQYLDSHPAEKERFWRDNIGDQAFEELRLRAHGAA